MRQCHRGMAENAHKEWTPHAYTQRMGDPHTLGVEQKDQTRKRLPCVVSLTKSKEIDKPTPGIRAQKVATPGMRAHGRRGLLGLEMSCFLIWDWLQGHISLCENISQCGLLCSLPSIMLFFNKVRDFLENHEILYSS